MLVFGIARSSPTRYEEFAEPGLRRILDTQSAVIVKDNPPSIAAAYNEILNEAGRLHPDAEAVVLMHQDLEIQDAQFYEKIRTRLEDRSIGLIGVIGAQGIRSIVYWRATMRGYVEEEFRTLDFGRELHEVDAIDGMLMIVAPAASRTVRFDQSVAQGFHGYDIDYSMQVRASGLRVVVDAIDVTHHTRGGYGDRRAYINASRAWRRKWLKHSSYKVLAMSWLDEVLVTVRRERLSVRSAARAVCSKLVMRRRDS